MKCDYYRSSYDRLASVYGSCGQNYSLKALCGYALTMHELSAAGPKEIARYFEISHLKSLKNDAFKGDLNGRASPFFRVALHCAALACIMTRERKNRDESFKALVVNDIERVESTPGLTWRGYAQSLNAQVASLDATHIADLINEVGMALFIAPQVKGKEMSGPWIWRDWANLQTHANELAAMAIVTGKSSGDLLKLNAKWHRAGNQIPGELLPLFKVGSWEPLFPPFDCSNGVRIACLTSSGQLESEGSTLKHCVGSGGYVSACRSGSTHIVSLSKDGCSIATIELSSLREPHDFKISATRGMKVIQFYGERNYPPSLEAKLAWREFLKAVKRSMVPFASRTGMSEKSMVELAEVDLFSQRLGFKIADYDTLRPKFLAHYRSRMSVERGRNRMISLLGEEKGEG